MLSFTDAMDQCTNAAFGSNSKLTGQFAVGNLAWSNVTGGAAGNNAARDTAVLTMFCSTYPAIPLGDVPSGSMGCSVFKPTLNGQRSEPLHVLQFVECVTFECDGQVGAVEHLCQPWQHIPSGTSLRRSNYPMASSHNIVSLAVLLGDRIRHRKHWDGTVYHRLQPAVFDLLCTLDCDFVKAFQSRSLIYLMFIVFY